MEPNINNVNNEANCLDPPKIILIQSDTKSISTNVENERKTSEELDKKECDKVPIIDENHSKIETDKIFIDPFTRWIHQKVGKILCKSYRCS